MEIGPTKVTEDAQRLSQQTFSLSHRGVENRTKRENKNLSDCQAQNGRECVDQASLVQAACIVTPSAIETNLIVISWHQSIFIEISYM